MSRVQAVLVLAQSLPLLATNPALGAAVDVVGTPPVLVVCGTTLALAAATALVSRALAAPSLTDSG